VTFIGRVRFLPSEAGVTEEFCAEGCFAAGSHACDRMVSFVIGQRGGFKSYDVRMSNRPPSLFRGL